MLNSLKLSIFLVLIFSVIVGGCGDSKKESKLLNEVIKRDSLEELGIKIKDDPDFSAEEVNLFNQGVSRITRTNDTLEGKKVSDIIKSQEEFIRSQQGLSLQNTLTKIELSMNHQFQFKGVRSIENDKVNLNVLDFAISNKSDKDIVNMQGVLQFYNAQNSLVKQYNIITKDVLASLNQPTTIPAEKTANLAAAFDYSNESRRDNIIRNNWKQLRIIWQPTMIEYADGSKIGNMVDMKPQASNN